MITASQYKKVEEALLSLPTVQRAGLLISLLCGLRRGELAGLTWDDVDFKHSILTVRHTLIEYPDEAGKLVRTVKTGTKNGSVRTVGLPDVAREALKQYQEQLPKEPKLWKDEVTGDNYPMLWLKPDGRLRCLEYFGHMWRLFRKQLQAEGILTQQARLHDSSCMIFPKDA